MGIASRGADQAKALLWEKAWCVLGILRNPKRLYDLMKEKWGQKAKRLEYQAKELRLGFCR